MIITPVMTPEHFDLIEPDPAFEGFKACMDVDNLMDGGKALAWVERDQGTVLAVGGYIERLPGVLWIWFLPSAAGSRMLLRISRHFERWIATLKVGTRVEATIKAEFEAGNRWAAMLGLEQETGEPMRLWDGRSDYHLYARVTGAENGSI